MTTDAVAVPAERALESEYLEDLLRTVERSNEPSAMAVMRYASRHKLRIVLGSALMAEGRPVTPGLALEVEFWRRQAERYRTVVDRLVQDVPSLVTLKGWEIGRLYPEGWLRESTDVDLVARDETDVWQAATRLSRQGWLPSGFALFRSGERVEVALNMATASEDDMLLDLQAIELTSCEFSGEPWKVAPCTSLAPDRRRGPSRQVLALLEEAFQRPWVARDLLDASLLLLEIGEAGIPALVRDIAGMGLVNEWSTLTARLRGLGLVDERLCRGAVFARGGSTARRIAFGARLMCRPPAVGAALMQRLQQGRGGRLAAFAEGTLLRRVGARAVLDAGLPVWGACVDGTPAAQQVTLVSHGGRDFARTPVGTFLLVYVSRLRPEWMRPIEEPIGA